jgi:hypothetical protein
MRRSSFAVLAALLACMLAGTPAAARRDGTPPIEGFRDVRFGTPLAAMPGMDAVEAPGPQRVCYERRGDDLRVGDGVAQSIHYCFVRDVLESVAIVARGERNTAALLSLFEASYGPGQRESSAGRGAPLRVLWPGRDASAWYGEPRSAALAQARIWSHDPLRMPPPRFTGRGATHDPHGDPPPPAGVLELGVPQRVRRGLVAQVSVRYRDIAPPATIELLLPPGMSVQSTVPDARVEGATVVWENLEAAAGNLKLKLLVSAQTPSGAAPLVQAVIFDAAGGRSEASAALRVR